MNGPTYRFSPLAESQLEEIWGYSERHFGAQQAERYVNGLFAALDELLNNGRRKGLLPRRVPPDHIADLTQQAIYYLHYEHHYLYVKTLDDGALGVVCILGERMDTPNRLREVL